MPQEERKMENSVMLLIPNHQSLISAYQTIVLKLNQHYSVGQVNLVSVNGKAIHTSLTSLTNSEQMNGNYVQNNQEIHQSSDR